MEQTHEFQDLESAPRPIPIPPDFPIDWERPEDARLFWQPDRMHFPVQLTMMDGEFAIPFHNVGFAEAARHYDMPVEVHAGVFNTYYYATFIPRFQTMDELREMERRFAETIGANRGRLMSFWEDEILAEVKSHIAYWQQFDLAGATLPELAEHLSETRRRMLRCAVLHFLLFPAILAPSMFDDTYRELLGPGQAFDSLELIQGFDNWSLRSDRAVWRLSRQVAELPTVRQLLESLPANQVVPALEESADGRGFLDELRSYLSEFGHRSDNLGLSRPSMIEDPTPVIETIKQYLTQPEYDPEAKLESAAAERERRLADVRARLQSYPAPIREQFEQALRDGQEGAIISEDHNYWIDFRVNYEVRQVLLEVGRRLAAGGALDSRDDVFHLSFAELGETLAHSNPSSSPSKDLVAERKAELAHFSTVQAPHVLGTEPPGPPPDIAMARFAGKFFGSPPPPPDQPRVINGAAGSPGVVRGPACVVHSLADASKLKAGDILVTPTTSPPWTPLFATAAAIVTDAGGILSHCAMVAREYGIPAVVGTGMATVAIPSGAQIEVDGSTGVVRLL